ncbi:MAG TPA: hypothetical protein VJS47_07195 [Rhizomicrobium sp.]|nr:hypothetical protein [Rhizomicrobium sp.]
MIVAVIILFAAAADQANPKEEVAPCPGRGLGSQYVVPNAQVAETIYRAIASALVPSNLKKFPIIVAEDQGDHWKVSQTDNAPPPKPEPNTVIVTAGGGQLYMTIDKCSGAVSDAALNR